MDIKRNAGNKKTKTTKTEDVKVNELKKNQIQVHFGNVEVLKLRLLEAIAKNTAEIVKLMNDVKESK